ncbi:hypothetical protein B0T19DRAFT_289068 [Cercophora scortea]|uniref:Secreted protein n=1 Tax=Cercophora scortea TaxID=314031 RepID=A0AAE0I2P7_9PEZI|nr:hypothetical protein B0T19DRAFT_289068 [Cercophora scortea]
MHRLLLNIVRFLQLLVVVTKSLRIAVDGVFASGWWRGLSIRSPWISSDPTSEYLLLKHKDPSTFKRDDEQNPSHALSQLIKGKGLYSLCPSGPV